MIPSDPAAARAATTFRTLLEEDPTAARQEFEALQTEMLRSHLLVGDQVAPFCFSPALVSQSRLLPIHRQVQRLVRLLTRLEPVVQRPRWMELLGISIYEQDLIRLEAGFEPGIHVSRVDGFLGPGHDEDTGFRIVELNIDSPGGAAYLDACAELLTQTSVWQRFSRVHPGRTLPAGPKILEVLLRAWRLWGGTGSPRVGIVDWITVSTASEFDVLRKQFLEAGIDTVVSDPRELEWKDGRLLDYDGRALDLVYRRVLVEDLLTHGEEARALLDAYRARAVCVVNPFRCKPLTVKSLLALVHRTEMEELLEAEEVRFLRTLVPWTAIVEEGPVLDRLEADQERMVLKPADSWGGQGIYLGWEMSPADWRTALETALKGRYVAQERVYIPQAEFPVLGPQGWNFHPFRMDFNPFTFGDQVGTPLMRLAASDLLNVKAGGQMTVTWVLG